MNAVLGIVILIGSGHIAGAQPVGAYQSIDECHAKVAAIIQGAGKVPEGMKVAALCLDLSDDIRKLGQDAPKHLAPGTTDL